MVVHTGTRQLKMIGKLIQESSENNCEFSSAEKRVLNTHTHWTLQSYGEKMRAFSVPYGFRVTGELELIYYNPLAAENKGGV